MKIAVVGATGLVGSKMLQVLDEQHIHIDELIVAASERSVGKEIVFQGKTHKVVSVEEAIDKCPDIAIFSAGGAASKQYAPSFAANGAFVIDNSSAWRMEKGVPLVVPEINADTITPDTHIIANPNCSTIQMVMALAPIHKAYGIKRLVISTVLPHGGDFCDNGYTTEEEKLVNETRKILRDPDIAITATVCRVPVTGGHSEAVNVETLKPFEIEEVRRLLENMPGVVVQDDPANNLYPMAITSFDKDEVFVGRIRRDHSIANGMNLWIVSDNIRKGAATNAVQIAKYLINSEFGMLNSK